MCYDIKASLAAQKSRAERSGDLSAAQEIEMLLRKNTTLPQSHLNGFTHPVLGLYTSEHPEQMSLGQWGLIPHWFEGSYPELKFNTLNARGESMFEKAAFSQAAEQYRGILLIDGFYEHQHRNSRIYPHFIYRQDKNPLAVACICQRRLLGDNHDTAEPRAHRPISASVALTFSIVTIKANALMSTIHNNPKIKEPRMPLILDHDMQAQWLEPITERSKAFEYVPSDASNALKLSEYFMSQSRGIELKAHTVAPLRKKRSTGLQHSNSKLKGKALHDDRATDAAAPYQYPELDQDWNLFSGLN